MPPRWLEWQKAMYRSGDPPTRAALAAAEAGDVEACLQAAREGATRFLRAFLQAVGCNEETAAGHLHSLLGAAITRDPYFARLRPQVHLLASGEPEASPSACESIVEALKEIRMLVGFRGCAALGADADRSDLDPRLEPLTVHSTTTERARSIFAQGAILSHNRCVERGLLSGTPPGVKYLLDPRRWLDYVFFHRPDPKYYAGEKVAHAHRTGEIDEGLTEDYQPSVRLFFRRATLEALPGWEDDGIPRLMVRDQVPLEHLACAVFPSQSARQQALAAVRHPPLKERLRPRCLVAPADSCADPAAYVAAANALVTDQLDREGPS